MSDRNDQTDDPKGLSVPAGRTARAARLGAMTAGVAGNMALSGLATLGRGERPRMRDLLLTPRNITRITGELAKMRGAAMKMGQLMSMDTGDVLPPELAQIMARLRDDAYIMPPKQLRAVLDAEWGQGWLSRFKRFDVRPIAAASIGQVHRAVTKDGRDLAIKVQYPGVAGSIDADVSNVGALVRMTGLLPKGFELKPYLAEAKRQLHDETDYTAEARSLTQFGRVLSGDERFIVPTAHDDWSTPRILAMDFVQSVPIESLETADQVTCNRAAHALIDLMLTELFDLRLMQTDPNFANYRWQVGTGRIVLLDFGATRALGDKIVADYAAIMDAGLAGDRQRLALAAERVGFLGSETNEQRHMILRLMELVFEALTTAPEFDFADPTLNRVMQAQGMALAETGYVPPPLPMDALFLQRKFAGMFLLAAKLRAKLPVATMLADKLTARAA
ncbi:MAG: AarF/ABC1/UbiB kinase family protein [Pseudomonadota bacterium]